MSFKKPFKIEEIDLKKLRFTDVKSNSKKTHQDSDYLIDFSVPSITRYYRNPLIAS